MQLPTEIISEIAKSAADWQTVIRMAGTCRQMRAKLVEMPLVGAKFMARDVMHAIKVLKVYKFVRIDLLGLAETRKSDLLGKLLIEVFDLAPEHAELWTSSVLVMDSFANMSIKTGCAARYKYLHYYVKYGRITERGREVECANHALPESFGCFREVTLDGAKISDIGPAANFMRNMTSRVCLSGCLVINFVNYYYSIVPVGLQKLIRIVNSNITYMFPTCAEIEVIDSKVLICGTRFPDVKSVRVSGISEMTLPDYFNLVFPNATMWREHENCIKSIEIEKTKSLHFWEMGDMSNFVTTNVIMPDVARESCFGAPNKPNMDDYDTHDYNVIDAAGCFRNISDQ